MNLGYARLFYLPCGLVRLRLIQLVQMMHERKVVEAKNAGGMPMPESRDSQSPGSCRRFAPQDSVKTFMKTGEAGMKPQRTQREA